LEYHVALRPAQVAHATVSRPLRAVRRRIHRTQLLNGERGQNGSREPDAHTAPVRVEVRTGRIVVFKERNGKRFPIRKSRTGGAETSTKPLLPYLASTEARVFRRRRATLGAHAQAREPRSFSEQPKTHAGVHVADADLQVIGLEGRAIVAAVLEIHETKRQTGIHAQPFGDVDRTRDVEQNEHPGRSGKAGAGRKVAEQIAAAVGAVELRHAEIEAESLRHLSVHRGRNGHFDAQQK
jgi:hypothetical protein